MRPYQASLVRRVRAYYRAALTSAVRSGMDAGDALYWSMEQVHARFSLRGASVGTLCNRVSYGGRKGARAHRRLRALLGLAS